MEKFIVHDAVEPRKPTSEPRRSGSPVSDAGYDLDFVLWLEQQVAALRARRFDAVDLGNLIEELESMGKRERRELSSRLETLLMHLLKCEFQPAMKGGGWLSTLLEQRTRIDDLLADSPSPRSAMEVLIRERFAKAVDRAALETGLAPDAFPSACNDTVDQVLDATFIP